MFDCVFGHAELIKERNIFALNNTNKYKGKRVLVCGLARSGVSSAVLLAKLGAFVTVQDKKTLEEIKEPEYFNNLSGYGIELYLGKNPDDIVQNFDLIIISPGIPYNLPFIEKAKSAGIEIIGEIELAYRLRPQNIIAVTGTNGKTTTTALIGEIMKAYKPGSVTVGNIGDPFTDKVLDLPEEAFAVVEVSSFQLESTVDFKPQVAVILNLTPDHLDRHGTFENYGAVKEKIFANQGENDYSVINFGDEMCRTMSERVRSNTVFFQNVQDLENEPYIIKLPGAHNVENVMAAVAAAKCAGVPDETIRRVVANFEGVEHRIEFITEINGAKYYNDSKATNTDAAIKALEAFDQPILLIGGGYDKKTDFTDWVNLFKGKVKKLVLIGKTSGQIKETCDKNGFEDYTLADDLRNAIRICKESAICGDVVLLSPACASFDMFDSYEHRGTVFKEYVKDLIADE